MFQRILVPTDLTESTHGALLLLKNTALNGGHHV
jgi:hypothetical protein